MKCKYLLPIICMSLISACGSEQDKSDSKSLSDIELEILKTGHLTTRQDSYSGKGDELENVSKAFIICNKKVYQNDKFERLARLFIQETLFSIPLKSLDSGSFDNAVKIAKNNPALSKDFSPVFISLGSPTSTQESIHKRNYLSFKSSLLKELVNHLEQTQNFKKSSLNNEIYTQDDLDKAFSIGLSPVFCGAVDMYLSLFDYSEINGFKTISREAAIIMQSSVRQEAISEVTNRLRNP